MFNIIVCPNAVLTWKKKHLLLLLLIIIIIVGPENLIVTPAHFTLGPKVRAEERHCQGHTTKVQMAQRYSRGRFYPQHPKALLEEKVSTLQKQFMEKLNTFALMGKGPLNSVTTKDKGRTTITTIKYSALDRAILFSFYNHPQPLWVWADRTSISPRKLNSHVDIGGRLKASIKGEGSKPKRVEGDHGRELEPPRPCRGRNLLRQARFLLVQLS